MSQETSRSFGACRTPTTAATWERCLTNSTTRSSGTRGCRLSSAGKPPCTGGTRASARESGTGKKLARKSRRASEVRDLGERVVAIGHLRARGKESGAITESALAWIVEFKSGKVIRVREYLDPKEALEAAGLSE